MTGQNDAGKRLTEGFSDEELQAIAKEVSEKIADSDHDLHFALDTYLGYQDQQDEGALSLTLVANGAVISGTAINRSRWLQIHRHPFDLDERSMAVFDDEEKFVTELQQRRKAVREELEVPPTPRTFINLKDVTVRNGSDVLSLPAMRVYVDSISAWSMVGLSGYQE